MALTLAAIVLGAASSSLLRQQRTSSALRFRAAGGAQVRAALGAIAAELAPLASRAGDLTPGQATDTTIQLRTVVATGVSCDDAPGRATLPRDDGGSASPWGSAPRVGDSLWWYAGARAGGWRGDVVAASDSVSAVCPLDGADPRSARRLSVPAPDTIRAGTPVRVTRPARYVFYRSGDGSWQLGLREWIEERRQFAAPQPIAGPFLRPGAGNRAGFRYFDAAGVELEPGDAGVDVGRVARVRLSVSMRGDAASPRDEVVRDSLDVALQGGPTPR